MSRPSIFPFDPPKALLFDLGGVVVVSPFAKILAYEHALNIPPGFVNFSISRSGPNGAWQRLERGDVQAQASVFREFTADLNQPHLWEQHWKRTRTGEPVPPMPRIDGERLFWTMMRESRQPDPYMWPALQKLKEDGRFMLAALSNTVRFPKGHEFNDVRKHEDGTTLEDLFEVFVSSSQVGLRKPSKEIYELAAKRMRAKRPELALREQDVVFFDDIGENCKAARELGLRTVKVNLGKTKQAVEELEIITGLKLLDERQGSRL